MRLWKVGLLFWANICYCFLNPSFPFFMNYMMLCSWYLVIIQFCHPIPLPHSLHSSSQYSHFLPLIIFHSSSDSPSVTLSAHLQHLLLPFDRIFFTMCHCMRTLQIPFYSPMSVNCALFWGPLHFLAKRQSYSYSFWLHQDHPFQCIILEKLWNAHELLVIQLF